MQRCLLYTCDPSVRHKEMEPSLAAAKTFAKLRVGSAVMRRASHSSSDGSPAAGAAMPAVKQGTNEEVPADVQPAAGLALRLLGHDAARHRSIMWDAACMLAGVEFPPLSTAQQKLTI